MTIKKDILLRVGVVYVCMLLFAIVVVVKIVYLQVVEHKEWTDKAKKMTLKDITIEPNRGDIYDCKGRLLASSVPEYEIRMDLNAEGLTAKIFRTKIDSLSLCLSKLFKDKSEDEYKREITTARREGKRFFLIQRQVSYSELKILKTFPLFRLGQNKGGLIFLQNNRRFQPQVDLATRTIGYLSKSETGNVVGIEGAYDSYLRGVKGVRMMQRLSGNVWMPLNDGNEVEPQDGKDVITSLDIEIQDVAENALLNQLKLHNAHHGTAIVMEVQTGEVKAIANLQRVGDGDYREIYNYGVAESTEPGSTFKLMSMIAALEDGYVDINDTVDTGDGTTFYYKQEVHDHEGHGLGRISVEKAFEVSSNVGISKVITRCYRGRERKFVDRLYGMGLNKKLGIDIHGEGAPDIKYPGSRFWSGISLPMMSIGYEVRLTPLQILSFYNAIANNGVMVKPKFVRSLAYHGNNIENFETQVLNTSVCSRSTLDKVRVLLEGVVKYGTAKNLSTTTYKIAGKTGTAQIANKKYGYKSDNSEVSYQASFVGYFPADNPKYSCIVVINAPSNKVYYGNLVAGPVFKEIADKVYAINLSMHQPINEDNNVEYSQIPFSKNGYFKDLALVLEKLGVPTSDEDRIKSNWVVVNAQKDKELLENRFVDKKVVPNVVGMGAKDALFLLENSGLCVTLNGFGKVKAQSVPAGTKVKLRQRIVLQMS